jgi:hypothetical protein
MPLSVGGILLQRETDRQTKMRVGEEKERKQNQKK